MSQYQFGTGQLFATPVAGGAPLRFGALQDVNLEISGDTKQLHGQYQYALDVARSKAKVEWKASSGNIDVAAFNQLFFQQTVVAGQPKYIQNEAGTIPATPFQLTAANGATFIMDLGVQDVLTGVTMKQVPSGTPNAGEYKVSSVGVYTFAAADTGKAVLINYLFTETGVGGTVTVNNALMGNIPRFKLVLTNPYAGNQFTVILFSAICDKLGLPLKQDDYLIADMSGEAFADSAGRVLQIATTSIVGGGL
jgi:hypothetical protein